MENNQNLLDLIEKLEERIKNLEEKYSGALADIKNLEEENIETSNCLYELSNQIDAVDARIDILAVEKWTNGNV
jgi:archaellum component FlaC